MSVRALEIFRLLRLSDDEVEATVERLEQHPHVDTSRSALVGAVGWIDFLEDERRRCYKELEENEVEIERLKDKVEQLMNELAGYVWDELRSSAIDRKKKESTRRMRWK